MRSLLSAFGRDGDSPHSAPPNALSGPPSVGKLVNYESGRLAILAVFFFAARVDLLHRLDSPTFGWRPAELAGIAVRYLRNGFHFAYPQVMWGGDGPGYVEMEFPLQSYLTALLYKVFGVHDGLNVVLPLLFGFGIVWATASIARHLYGDVAGVVAGIVVAISPTLIMLTDTGMYPDPPMVFFGTLSIYLLMLWSEGGATALAWTAAASLSLAVLFKLNALYLGLPVVYLFLRRFGRAWLKQPVTWGAAAVILLPPALWYVHANHLYHEYGNTFGILGAGYSKFSTLDMFFDAALYVRTLFRIFFYHLTPLGSLAVAYGLYCAFTSKQRLLWVWFFAVVLHSALVLKAIRHAGHVQYLLPILPVCGVFAGLGAQTALQHLREKFLTGVPRGLQWGALSALLVLTAANARAANQRFVHRDRAIDNAQWELKRLTGLRVSQVTRPGSLIVVVDDQMDKIPPNQSMTPPDVFFYGDRLGWYLSLAWMSVDKIEDLRLRGAEYFVVSLQSVDAFKAHHADIHAYLQQHYKLVTAQDALIYELRDGSAQPSTR